MTIAQYIKIVLIGDGTVGKTAIRNKFINQPFDPDYLMTIGSDFTVAEINIENVGQVMLQIWDLAGQPHFNVVRSLYYQGAAGALIVYDVINPISFQNIPNWLAELEKNAGSVPFSLVGNKIDLRDQAESAITREEGMNLCEQLTQEGKKVFLRETSALTGEGIHEIFVDLTKIILDSL
ncbi:MAG: GTP-binding protein [Candidatus Hodarchaeota archaeon]